MIERRNMQQYLALKESGACLRCRGRGMILIVPCFSMLCRTCKGTGMKLTSPNDTNVSEKT